MSKLIAPFPFPDDEHTPAHQSFNEYIISEIINGRKKNREKLILLSKKLKKKY
tara:strand:- start:388 stop:546 length:159 start_codon:yes stop_codon:yes gene_type:complete